MGGNFRPCSVDGCTCNAHWSAHGAKGLCSVHYQRVRIHGDASVNKRTGKRSPDYIKCSVDGCDGNAARISNGKRGMCSLHYQRTKRHGDPTVVIQIPSPAQDWLRDNATHSGDECLIWPFAVGADGYGRVHRKGNGPLTTAANVMCEMVNGPSPTERHECAHSCGRGNLGCVNPRHLYWATPSENQLERAVHGTSNRGERQWKAILTKDDVIEIRRLAGSVLQKDLAKRFGVTPTTVSNVIRRRNWQWL